MSEHLAELDHDVCFELTEHAREIHALASVSTDHLVVISVSGLYIQCEYVNTEVPSWLNRDTCIDDFGSLMPVSLYRRADLAYFTILEYCRSYVPELAMNSLLGLLLHASRKEWLDS